MLLPGPTAPHEVVAMHCGGWMFENLCKSFLATISEWVVRMYHVPSDVCPYTVIWLKWRLVFSVETRCAFIHRWWWGDLEIARVALSLQPSTDASLEEAAYLHLLWLLACLAVTPLFPYLLPLLGFVCNATSIPSIHILNNWFIATSIHLLYELKSNSKNHSLIFLKSSFILRLCCRIFV